MKKIILMLILTGSSLFAEVPVQQAPLPRADQQGKILTRYIAALQLKDAEKQADELIEVLMQDPYSMSVAAIVRNLRDPKVFSTKRAEKLLALAKKHPRSSGLSWTALVFADRAKLPAGEIIPVLCSALEARAGENAAHSGDYLNLYCNSLKYLRRNRAFDAPGKAIQKLLEYPVLKQEYLLLSQAALFYAAADRTEVTDKYAQRLDQYVKRIAALDPIQCAGHAQVGQFYLQIRRCDLAEREFVLANEQNASLANGLFLAEALAKQQKIKEALQIIQIPQNPAMAAMVEEIRIQILLDAKQYGLALQYFDHLPPKSPVRAKMALPVTMQCKDFASLYRFLKPSLKKAANKTARSGIWQILLSAAEKKATPQQIEAVYQSIAQDGLLADPNCANALAYTMAEKSMTLDRAQTLVQTALKADPGNAAYLDTAAWIAYKRKDFPAAVKWIEQALSVSRLPGGMSVLYYHAGEIYEASRQTEKAAQLYRLAAKNARFDREIEPELIEKKLQNFPVK